MGEALISRNVVVDGKVPGMGTNEQMSRERQPTLAIWVLQEKEALLESLKKLIR